MEEEIDAAGLWGQAVFNLIKKATDEGVLWVFHDQHGRASRSKPIDRTEEFIAEGLLLAFVEVSQE